MSGEKDQLRENIKILFENMLCLGIEVFIIIILEENMEYLYGFVKFFILCEDDVRFINFIKKLIKGDRIEIL